MNKIESLENSLYTAQMKIHQLEERSRSASSAAMRRSAVWRDLERDLAAARKAYLALEQERNEIYEEHADARRKIAALEAERDGLRPLLQRVLEWCENDDPDFEIDADAIRTALAPDIPCGCDE